MRTLPPPYPAWAAAVWHDDTQRIADGFITTFSFRIVNAGGVQGGGDGLVFVIHGGGTGEIGSGGGGIGYQGIGNSLAVEFDTYLNSERGDPDNHHLSIHLNGDSFETNAIGSTSIPDVRDGNAHTARIEYDGPSNAHQMRVFLDNTLVLTVTANLPEILPNLGPMARIGFTAGAAAAYENHDILSWSFAPPRVTRVTYEQIFTDDLPIDADPNADPNDPNQVSGRRIFPDRKDTEDQIERSWIKVRAKYTTPTAGVRIYFRNFDLDDPSAAGPPVDPNNNAGWDNRGSVLGTGSSPAGFFDVEEIPQCTDAPGPQSSQIVSCLTDANGEVAVDYFITQRQGDNFAVAASLDPAFLSNVAVNGVNLTHPTSGDVPISDSIPNPCESSTAVGCRTSMLTVWRRLHIEYDAMGQVSKNYVEGNFYEPRTVPAGDEVLLPVFFADLVDRDQLQGGTFKTGERLLHIVRNGDSSVTVNNPSEFEIVQGQSFLAYDDDDFNDNDGLVPKGDEGETVTMPGVLLMLEPLDSECVPASDPSPCNVLAPAYIRPVYDLGGNDFVPFYKYLNDDDRNSLFGTWFFNRDHEGRENFWVIYLLTAYQPDQYYNNDPDRLLFGTPDRIRTSSDHRGAVLFLELNRAREYDYMDLENEGIPSWQNRPVSRRHEFAREVGVMFGGRPTDADGEPDNAKSLMAGAEIRMRSVFGETTLTRIRDTKFP